MSSTRSISRTAPATEAAEAALIVAHGSPSDPAPQEAAIAALAVAVAARLPGWRITGATLAAPGALGRALEAGPAWIYPLFMSDGWFVSRELPRRLAAAGRAEVAILPPLGLDPALAALCAACAREAATGAGYAIAETTVILAAHGSPRDPRPAAAAGNVARRLRATGGFRAVATGFVDESPRLADALRVGGPALCLPFFAARAGHVTGDLPEAVAEAGFRGPVLGPIGADPGVPDLIAGALRRSAAARLRPAAPAGAR